MADESMKLERSYRAFVRCRQIVRDAESEQQLLRDICQAAVNELGFRLAWIGLVALDDPVVRPVAEAGYEDGYLSSIRITWSDDEFGQGPTGRAIREGRPAIARDIANDSSFAPWRSDALLRGYASSAALPLLDGSECLGTLNLYAGEPDAFDDDELALLEEVATDLVLGIRRLRTREALEQMSIRLDRAMFVEAAAMATTAIAHDLNNLLQVITASVSLAKRTQSEDKRNKALDDAERAAQSTASLSRRLISLVRRTTNGDIWSDVEHVIRGASPLLRRLAPRAAVEFHLAPGVRAPISALDLERILINLVVNAHQAMPSGGALLISSSLQTLAEGASVSSGWLPQGSYATIAIEDNGEGISPQILPHIFEPLFTTKGERGTGLGLPAVLALLTPAKGAINVESPPPGGTRVTLYLPITKDPTGVDEPP